MSDSRASSLGQLLILGLHDYRWPSELERMLRTLQPAGVLLAPACLRTPGQTAELLHRIARALDVPPVLAIAEEGGSVDPLKSLLPPLPAPRVAARRGPTAVKRLGELIGRALKLLGFNSNFAPRLDLSDPDAKPPLDTQTFSADPKQVARCGRGFIEGLSQHKILTCGMHFPGRRTPEYDDNGSPIVGEPMAELWREDLLPFRELLPHLPLVKLSNLAYKAYDFDGAQPAAISSKVVHDLLRVKLGYRGLAVADLLEPPKMISPRSTGRRAAADFRGFILSVKAGCDFQVVQGDAQFAQAILGEIQRELATGTLAQERVDEALRRVRNVQESLKRPSGKLSARNFDHLAREFEAFGEQIKRGGEIDA